MSWLKWLLVCWILVSGLSFIFLWRLLYVQSKESERYRKAQRERNWRMAVRVAMIEDELGIEVTKLPGGNVPLIKIIGRG